MVLAWRGGVVEGALYLSNCQTTNIIKNYDNDLLYLFWALWRPNGYET